MRRACGTAFAQSERGTLGIEWELALVDRQTGDLRSVAQRILEAARAEMPELSGMTSTRM